MRLKMKALVELENYMDKNEHYKKKKFAKKIA